MDAALYRYLRDGGLVLTVNNRLARQIRESYDHKRVHEGAEAWLRPQVHSLLAWCEGQFRSLRQGPEILGPAQSLRLWENIIEADQDRRTLLHVPQTARRALRAHQLLIRYGVDFTAAQAALDQQAFLHWRSQWLQMAEHHGWVDAAASVRLLAAALEEHRCAAPKQAILAGFDQLTPDVALLADVLKRLSCSVEMWAPAPPSSTHLTLFDAADPQAEVACCARWIRNIRKAEPLARIGIVVPRLEDYRGFFATVFQDELDPTGILEGVETNLAFNISLGRPAGQEGPVYAALRLLQVGSRLTTDDFGWLLRSPYVGRFRRDFSIRAKLDKALRESGTPEWTLSSLQKFCSRFCRDQQKQGGDVQTVLNLLAARSRIDKRRLPGDWAESFLQDLQQLGWPGDRPLSSREFQAAETLQKLLADLAGLDRVSRPMARREAVSILARLATDTEFQPESQGNEVQVLGLLESAGLSFDYLWLPGLHDGALPQPPRPNPFIPLTVQRRAGMERADAARERRFAEQVAERLFHCAPEVVLSWPRQIDGIAQRPSPLLPALATGGPVLADTAHPAGVIHNAGVRLEKVRDARAPALKPGGKFAGGTGILKDQALCPFRAFAHYRLHARRLERPEIGLDNLSRGSLVHSALEFFWKQIETQSALQGLSGQELASAVRRAVDAALGRLEREKRRDIAGWQKEIEGNRLVSLLMAWLRLEAERAPFAVQSVEKNLQVAVGRLSIRTRVDRIDRLASGGLAILDYKTGRCDTAQWFDERLTEPQLPVYCLSRSVGDVEAVLFAQVRSRIGECGFRGVTRSAESWPGLAAGATEKVLDALGWRDFDDIIGHWRQALERLGNAFVDGDAIVDPVSREAACRFCDLVSLCRIHEAGSNLSSPEQGHG